MVINWVSQDLFFRSVCQYAVLLEEVDQVVMDNVFHDFAADGGEGDRSVV